MHRPRNNTQGPRAGRSKEPIVSLSHSRLQAVCVHRIDTAQERAFLRKRRGSPTLHLHPQCAERDFASLRDVQRQCYIGVILVSLAVPAVASFRCSIVDAHTLCTGCCCFHFLPIFSSKPLATTTIHTLGEANAVRLLISFCALPMVQVCTHHH